MGIASKLSAFRPTCFTTTASAHFAASFLSVAKLLTCHDCLWPVSPRFSLFHRPLVGSYEVFGVSLAVERMPHVGERVAHSWNVPASKILLDADPSRTGKACELPLVKGPTYLPSELPQPPLRARTILSAQVPRSEDLRSKNGCIPLAVSNKAIHNLTVALYFTLHRCFRAITPFARNALCWVRAFLRHAFFVAEPRKQPPCQCTVHGKVRGVVCKISCHLHPEEQKQHGSPGLCTDHHRWGPRLAAKH